MQWHHSCNVSTYQAKRTQSCFDCANWTTSSIIIYTPSDPYNSAHVCFDDGRRVLEADCRLPTCFRENKALSLLKCTHILDPQDWIQMTKMWNTIILKRENTARKPELGYSFLTSWTKLVDTAIWWLTAKMNYFIALL